MLFTINILLNRVFIIFFFLSFFIFSIFLPINPKFPKTIEVFNPDKFNPHQILKFNVTLNNQNFRGDIHNDNCINLIGDSFVFGILDDNDVISNILKNTNPDDCFNNFGSPGKGIRFYKFILAKNKSKTNIVFLYLFNDLNYNFLIKYTLLDYLLISPFISRLTNFYSIIKSTFLNQNNSFYHLNNFFNNFDSHKLRRGSNIFENFNFSNNLIFVIVLSKLQFYDKYIKYYSENGFKLISKIDYHFYDHIYLECVSKGFVCLYPINHYKEYENNGVHVFNTIDDHPNSIGTKIIADLISNYLNQR